MRYCVQSFTNARETSKKVRKLPEPRFQFAVSKSECLKGVSDPGLHARYKADLRPCKKLEDEYITKARNEELFSLPRVPRERNDDSVVLGTLTKQELTKLYTDYFVPEKKAARRLYDQLKVTANGKCPLCGDIGHVRSLDHYLPKANFPVYSVLPGNLVPCCRDCNTGKLNSFSLTKDGQSLHPYFDCDKYFQEKWICADIVRSIPPTVAFYSCPPGEWQAWERGRVNSHFKEYDLAKRFGTEAAADIPEIVNERRTSLKYMTANQFSSHLLEKSQNSSLPVNNWRRVMFDAMAKDNWFCEQRFIDE